MALQRDFFVEEQYCDSTKGCLSHRSGWLVASAAWLVVSGVGKRGPHGNHPGDHPGENRLPPGNPRDLVLRTLK